MTRERCAASFASISGPELASGETTVCGTGWASRCWAPVNGYLDRHGLKIGAGTIRGRDDPGRTLVDQEQGAEARPGDAPGEDGPSQWHFGKGNREKSRTRSRVEHVFALIKLKFGS